MGAKSSKNENPSFLRQTFSMGVGDSQENGAENRLEWRIEEIVLYRFRVKLIGRIIKSKFYFLLVEVKNGENLGFFIVKFDRKGSKSLEFYEGKNQALFSPFSKGFDNPSVEVVRKLQVPGKCVKDLVEAFEQWNLRFNLLMHNTKDFCSFIQKRLLVSN